MCFIGRKTCPDQNIEPLRGVSRSFKLLRTNGFIGVLRQTNYHIHHDEGGCNDARTAKWKVIARDTYGHLYHEASC